MSIIALCIVSASEIALVKPDFSYQWADENKKEFDEMLYQLGMDMQAPIERQETVQHKNRLEQVVICDRWVGYERTDMEWINSGYASREAKDKATGNKLLEDLYKAKGLTE